MSDTPEVEALKAKVTAQGLAVRDLKANKASKEEVRRAAPRTAARRALVFARGGAAKRGPARGCSTARIALHGRSVLVCATFG